MTPTGTPLIGLNPLLELQYAPFKTATKLFFKVFLVDDCCLFKSRRRARVDEGRNERTDGCSVCSDYHGLDEDRET